MVKKRLSRLQQCLYPFTMFVDLCRTKFSWKKSMLVLYKILRLFANRLTDDDKYSFLNRDNLTQPIQILLSQKQKRPFFNFSLHSSNVH